MARTKMDIVALILNGFPQSSAIDYESFLLGAELALEEIDYAALKETAKRYLSGKIERKCHSFHPSVAEIVIEARKVEWEMQAPARRAEAERQRQNQSPALPPAPKKITVAAYREMRREAKKLESPALRATFLRLADSIYRENKAYYGAQRHEKGK